MFVKLLQKIVQIIIISVVISAGISVLLAHVGDDSSVLTRLKLNEIVLF